MFPFSQLHWEPIRSFKWTRSSDEDMILFLGLAMTLLTNSAGLNLGLLVPFFLPLQSILLAKVRGIFLKIHQAASRLCSQSPKGSSTHSG